jgi:hypothetical protein
MANIVPNSFKQELLSGTHDFTPSTGNAFKLALYSTTSGFSAAGTTNYTATITASAALIYNSTVSDKAIVVLDFGGDQTSTNGDFTIEFPTADSSNAIVRIA